MQAKKYKARTIAEAMARIRSDLGADAMIISTRKMSDNMDSQIFEITAVDGTVAGNAPGTNSIEAVQSELMSIKEMICLTNNAGGLMEKLVMQPALLSLYAQMIRNGVAEHYVRHFLESSGTLDNAISGPPHAIKKQILKRVVAAIDVKKPFDLNACNRTVAAFIGTTGVGKTTTVAKLAAQLMLKENKKVGLISIDNYRIGALEQLKTYANILGIPCYPAFNSRDLQNALKKMENRDVVLIDTAGQSQYDNARMNELKKMISGEFTISTHLLLNVGAAEQEMNNTAVNFSSLKYESYIFTKVDEAAKCGSIINQSMRLQLPISYITTGQNVPEDIEPGSKRRVLDLVFRGSRFKVQGSGLNSKAVIDKIGV